MDLVSNIPNYNPDLSNAQFLDPSLCNGLVRRFTKQVETLFARIPTRRAAGRINELLEMVYDGVPPKRRKSHFQEFVKCMSYTTYQIPLTLQRDYAITMSVTGNSEEDKLYCSLIIFNYRRKTIMMPDQLYVAAEESGNCAVASRTLEIELNSSHVLARYLQRENTTDINHALVSIHTAIIDSFTTLTRRPIGPCNIEIMDKGMLLGDVISRDSHKVFSVKTYIDRSKVHARNFEELAGRDRDTDSYSP
ncbi:hypothetical protein [Vibrio mediterranei]|uniref:hypothetical protein n=1 Tax=Vibrio mediterranei TaxID=689 RepID=UPI004067D74A